MIYVFFGVRMKRIIGFALFFFGLGMLAMFLIPGDFCGILIMIGCILLGYYFFVVASTPNNKFIRRQCIRNLLFGVLVCGIVGFPYMNRAVYSDGYGMK